MKLVAALFSASLLFANTVRAEEGAAPAPAAGETAPAPAAGEEAKKPAEEKKASKAAGKKKGKHGKKADHAAEGAAAGEPAK